MARKKKNSSFSASRRNLIRSAGAAGVALVGGYAIHRHDVNSRQLHDLASVGKGAPAIVQIHDPGCRLCRQLKKATETALKSHPDIIYRLADITKPEGREWQQRFDVPHVTLLLFDDKGKLLNTFQGVRGADELDRLITETFKPAVS